ncbi:limbic system-associated membrane protein [Colias croceus]|uniref:limbic system-associated membrane protein n=1 Tax=Colias crocea TaxID=72248 RepID=UPI001E27E50A|nr:limbic system-associated membrane protein [Colias croceus]XP_045500902.1 limbic system-associated membrane protein [Colias croceus]XP_045500903.1 limbic system-associated membrane protein [Colias croceus]XP_045500904.1 limbic system-associated membrane protein [Colias croceus]XP_045500905.1 limbic system-associated membrane protein [Colias croceus]XP_045500906.1 limbic system-associated membrane protein [Colias croceus]
MRTERSCFWSMLQALALLPTMALRDSHTTKKFSEEPEFERPIGNHTFFLGREAVLGCSVLNLGKHKVGWLRAEDQTVLTMHERAVLGSRYAVSLDPPRTWQLRIRPLRAEDRGCYMCQINTQPTMTWQIGCIDVFVPPDIMSDDTSGDVSVQELENATLTCKATGHPPPKITWRREDHEPILLKKPMSREFEKVESYVGSSMPLWRVDRRQMGAFLCIASNDVPPAVSKRITLNVNFAPTVKVPNQLLGAPLGTDVKLKCYVEAYPNTINYWIKNRGEMLLDGPKYTIREEKSSYKVSMWLTIRQFSKNDIGTYNCVSTNSLGKSEGTLRLYEIKLNSPEDFSNQISVAGGLTEAAKANSQEKLHIKRTLLLIISCVYLYLW